MSNKIGRPWYKKPTIVIPALIGIVAIVVTIIIPYQLSEKVATAFPEIEIISPKEGEEEGYPSLENVDKAL